MGPPPGQVDPQQTGPDLRAAVTSLEGDDRAVLALDRHGVVVAWNGRASRVTGWAPEAVRGKPLSALLLAAFRADLAHGMERMRDGRGWTARMEMEGPRTKALRVELSVQPILVEGELAGAVGVLRPLTVDHAERAAGQLSAAMRHVSEAVVVCDPDGRVTEWNPAAEAVLGWSRPEMLGCPIERVVPAHAAGQFRRAWLQLAAGRDVRLRAASGLDRSGVERPVSVHATAFRERGAFAGVVATLGAPPPGPPGGSTTADTALQRRLETSLSAGQERAVAVIVVEGVEFLAGDRAAAASRDLVHLRVWDAAPPADAFERPGGGILLVLDSANVRAEIGEVLHDCRAAVARPIETSAGDVVHLSARVGVAASDSAPVGDLLEAAEQACTQAQLDSEEDLRWYTPRLRPPRPRLELVADLRRAIGRDELRVLYQPIVELRTRRPCGAEALLRWEHPREGLLRPAAFLSLAEDTGLIHEIGTWVVRSVCQAVVKLKAQGMPYRIAVNVSAQQLVRREFADLISSVLDETGCPPGLLGLEVTETAVTLDLDAAVATLGRLKEVGVDLALDDFGTGYSSLLYLKHFPVDAIKIDRSFVAGLGASNEDGAIVASTLSLARRVGVRCIAEGVETVEQLELLRKMGCDEAQGYLFGRPVSLDLLPGPAAEERPTGPRAVKDPPVPTRDVVEILRRHEDGASPHTIAAGLNAAGHRRPSGVRWHAKSVAAVIAQAAYPEQDWHP
jgi:PAS domain S-box-containing protein